MTKAVVFISLYTYSKLKKLFIGMRLCKNFNWNLISFVLLVHFLAKT